MNVPDPRGLPIRLRLAVWYTLFLVITIAAISIFLLTALKNNLQRDVDIALVLRASHVERVIAIARDGGLERGEITADVLELTPVDEFSAPGIYVQILDREGAVLVSSLNLPEGQLPVTSEMVAAALAGREEYATVPAESERVRVLARPVMSDDGVAAVVLVGESLHPLEVTLRRIEQLLVLAGAVVAVAALASGWWLTANALGPIAEVTRVARRIAATGKFEQRISAPLAHDELSVLTATFNEMLARLEKTFQKQQEFLADASHELRGPLMVIRGNLDLLKLDIPEEERQACAREATEEIERMSRLVSDLLFLGEVDAQEVVSRQPVGLHEVVHEVWERAKTLDDGSHQVVLARNDPTTVLGDRDRLDQMLWNLVENALRYTPKGGRMSLSLCNYEQIAELIVSDTGIGIPNEHLPRIFERFYRVERARSRNKGSTGLGLAIIKQVVEAHGGQVRVRSEPGEGSVFTVALPTHLP